MFKTGKKSAFRRVNRFEWNRNGWCTQAGRDVMGSDCGLWRRTSLVDRPFRLSAVITSCVERAVTYLWNMEHICTHQTLFIGVLFFVWLQASGAVQERTFAILSSFAF